ncbi:sigma-70 family RNA polymerase sigma factor [Kribbella sp. NPDC051770]|uniref:sigma-70 family RNA polymerase sigma factor n=1 Tax=Kribbella sp. NPDC051770 TaxID=3155413 RepID=UPI00342D1218
MTTTASFPQLDSTTPETVQGLRDRLAAEIDRLLTEATEAEEPRRTELYERATVLGIPLAHTLASRYRGRGVDAEDLDQVASVGLVKAVKGYVPSPERDFRSYAVPTIRGEICRHFRDNAWMVRPPRRIQDLQTAINGIETTLSARLDRWPTCEELAEALGVPVEQVVAAQGARNCFHAVSLDAMSSASAAPSLADQITHDADTYRLVDHLEALRPAVANLSARDQLILRRYFVEHRTQAEIGREIGRSQMQVSRYLNQILGVLRTALSA